MFFNEGVNDRFAGTFNTNKNITTDIFIDSLLNKTAPERIWFGTDYHLFKFNTETCEVSKNKDSELLIRNQNKYVNDDDIFIFLGDLVDDECQNYDELKLLIKDKLKGKIKILILGNNDLNTEKYYNELGFDYIFYAYQWNKITFSHKPLSKFNTQVNIHGHMHEWNDYVFEGISYNDHIKIYTKSEDNKPINLKTILDRYNKGYYLNKVKENKKDKVKE